MRPDRCRVPGFFFFGRRTELFRLTLKYNVLSDSFYALGFFMSCNLQRESLVSQHIEVARIYKEMLGMDDAIAYLVRENIPREIAEQALLAQQHAIRPEAPTLGQVAQAPHPACRRKNRVHDAIVEAALKIERKLGTAWALALLKEEQVPEEVAARIIAQGPRQVRARRPAP